MTVKLDEMSTIIEARLRLVKQFLKLFLTVWAAFGCFVDLYLVTVEVPFKLFACSPPENNTNSRDSGCFLFSSDDMVMMMLESQHDYTPLLLSINFFCYQAD